MRSRGLSLTLLFLLAVSPALADEPLKLSDPDGGPGIVRSWAEPGQTADQVLRVTSGSRAATMTEIDPGPAPEGDYMGNIAFTPDGSRVLVTNSITENVTVFDWATMAALANVDVGVYPGGIAATNDYAVVACAFDDTVHVIDLSDYSTAAVFDTAEQPWVVRISPDGSRAYVACDIDDVCEVIDLGTMSHVMSIENFPISLLSWSWGSESSRTSVEFTGFEVTPDGNHLLAFDREDSLFFINTVTGAVDHMVSGVGNTAAIGLSGDGWKAVVVEYASPTVARRIDLATRMVDATVTVTGYSLSTTAVGVDATGAKAYLGVSDNSSAFVRFATGDFSILTSTYTPFDIGTSPDHSLAIGMQYRFSVLDFATESLLGQYQGYALDHGAVSPVGTRVAAFHPIFSESVHFYDYGVVNGSLFRGAVPSGLDPEGDAPRRVAVSADGTTAVATNVLSDNASIIDVASGTVEAVLPMGDRVQDVAITSDSRWAVVCAFETNSVKIVDLETNTVAADVPCGSRAGVVALAPDDSHAYVGNISGNSISVVELDGADSSEVAEIPCGVIGVVWAAYGVSSGVACSPDGDEVLVAASFDDQVKVIDTSTNSIVASLTVGDFPLQVAFDGSGDYAVVTNYFADSYSILQIDGAASSVVGTFSCGDAPLRVAWNAALDRFGIGVMTAKTVLHVDPATGDVLGSDSFSAYGSVIDVAFDETGGLLALTTSAGDDPGHLHWGGEAHALPAGPCSFTYSPAARAALAACPGPDAVALVSEDALPLIVTGPGPGPVNPTEVRVFNAGDPAVPLAAFSAYGVDRFGVNPACGDIDGDGVIDLLTGPGPGAVFGPHVRGWSTAGAAMGDVSFFAYGTPKYGVNVAAGDIDGDGNDEIITGAGPGVVYGPHVRGWDYDGAAVTSIGAVSFFAYGTPKYGVNVACGDIDGDGIDEIVTGAGPGTVYGPHVRGWNYDGAAVNPLAGVSFLAYGTNQYGVNVTCGDLDGDGFDEIVTGPGPGVVFGAHIRGWDVDGGSAVPMGGVNFVAYPGLLWGAGVGAGDLDGDAFDEVLTVPGPGTDPSFTCWVRGWNVDGGTAAAIASIDFNAYGGTATHGGKVAAVR